MTVAVLIRLTARVLLGRRRVFAFLVFPVLVVGLAVLARALGGVDEDAATAIAGVFGFVALLPILCVVAGTGVIGPEIEDGSIIYLLAKPIRRSRVVLAKLVVAIGTCLAFGTASILVAGGIAAGTLDGPTVTFAVASVFGILGYCSLLLLLAVVTRHAVVIGIAYALVWESAIGSFLPGVRDLSVQQWSLALADAMLGDHAEFGEVAGPTVGTLPAAILLGTIVVGSTWLATQRLRSLRMTDAG